MKLLHYSEHVPSGNNENHSKDDAPVAVLLHGLFGSLDNLSVIRRELAGKYRVINMDLPDHGQSPWSDHFSFVNYAQQIANTLNHLGIKKAHFVAHSLGGKIAMSVAKNAPDLVDKLIILDIAPVAYEPRHENVLTGLKAVDLNKITQRKDAQKLLATHIKDLGTQSFLLKSLYQTENNWAWRFNLKLLARDYSLLSDWQKQESCIFKGQVLFIKGANSDYIKAHHQATIMTMFPNAQAKIVNAGHWLHAEKPQLVNRLITRFLHGDNC